MDETTPPRCLLIARQGPEDREDSVQDHLLELAELARSCGFEVLTRIKAEPLYQHIPVMMLTTESERSKIIQAIKAGAVNYICKPFTPEDLTVKITDSLGAAL